MRRSEFFFFDSADLLHYDLHKISLNRSVSYIDSPEQLKDKKSTIDSTNNDDKYFEYALAVALSCEQIKIHPERISKTKLFIGQYNWREDFPSHKKDWKKLESNNKLIDMCLIILKK